MFLDRIKKLAEDAKEKLEKVGESEIADKVKGYAEDATSTIKHHLGRESMEDVIARTEREKERNLKKASQILAGDFASKAKDYKFYINNDYTKPYTQGQWLELYKELAAKEDPEALAPMYNAIVVRESGICYYVRRGLEMMPQFSPVSFIRGTNDRISETFIYEPYTYHEHKSTYTPSYSYGYSSHTSSSSSQPTKAAQSQPAGPKPLSTLERAELNSAKRIYESAARDAARHPNEEIFVRAEKNAYAEYMRVLAKYAGRE